MIESISAVYQNKGDNKDKTNASTIIKAKKMITNLNSPLRTIITSLT